MSEASGRSATLEIVDVDARAAELRARLTDELVAAGSIRTGEVEAAFRVVPRHLFAPEATLEEAYADAIVRIKRDERGVTISSVSAPWLQATMLEQAEIRPGMRVLEVGSGGFNAALIAELVGPAGVVTTVDIDPDVTDRASRCLTRAGYDRVRVVLADAEHELPRQATPFDRIIVTAGTWDIPPAWTTQLARGGRIVAPLRMRGLSRTIALRPDRDELVSLDHQMAGFVPVQGAGAHAEQLVPLSGEDVGLRFDEDDGRTSEVDGSTLRRALLTPRSEAWSGVLFGEMEPFDGLMLWLATVLDDYCLLSRSRSRAARELVDPASPLGTPTALGADSFAYLTFRPSAAGNDTYEFGAYGHGPDGSQLADQLVAEIRRWDLNHRHGPPAVITVRPASRAVSDAPPGSRVIRKRHRTVLLRWP